MTLVSLQFLRRKLSRGARARLHLYCAAVLALSVFVVFAFALLPTYGTPQVQFGVNQTGWVSMASTADFNCDNIPDVVALRLLGGSTNVYQLTIALADGHGGFYDGTSQIYAGSIPLVQHQGKILIEDFNGDGRPDIFTADVGIDGSPYTGRQNTLSLSTPDCHLLDATSYLPQQSDFTHSAAAGDIDNDGDVDIYVGNIWGANLIPPQIWVNDGTGHFTISPGRLPAAQTDLNQNRYTASLFVDVNNDGNVDLVLGGENNTPQSQVLLNDGTGHFSVLPNAMPAKPFGTDAIPLDIQSTDINHDGYADLVIPFTKWNPYYQGRWLQILINNGDGTFSDQTASRLPQVDNLLSWDIFSYFSDFDGDGNNDLVGRGVNKTAHQFFTASGAGVFTSVPLASGKLDDVFTLVDAKGDGHRDILTIGNPNDVDTFSLVPDTGPVLPPGIPQAVRATRGVLGHIRLWWPYVWGATSYEVWRSSTPGNNGTLIATVSRTSYDDTPVAEGTTNYYRIRAVNSAGTSGYSVAARGKSEQPPPRPLTDLLIFGSRQTELQVNLTGRVSMAATADFNCDHIPDVVAVRVLSGSNNTYSPTIALGDGHGGYVDGTSQIYVNGAPITHHPSRIIIEDFNGDGRPDIFTSDTGADGSPWAGWQNTLSLSTPDCRLQNATGNLPQLSGITNSATAADVDNDGDVDLFIGNTWNANGIPPQIWLNDGTGHFTVATGRLPAAQTDFNQNRYTASLFVDVNNDGFVDLVLGGWSDTAQSVVLLNNGSGVFSVLNGALPAKAFASDAVTLDIEAADINHDGSQDLVMSFTKNNFQGGRWLQILINNGSGIFTDQTATLLPQSDNTNPWYNSAQFVDLDGDGNNDLSTTGFNSISNQFFLASNSGAFTALGLLSGSLDDVYAYVDVNGNGHRDVLTIGNPSDVDTFTLIPNTSPPFPPGIPQYVRATMGLPNRIRLFWPYVWGATGYEVWRSSTSGNVGTLVKTVSTTSLDDYPQVGASAYYRIRAVNSAGTSDYSAVVHGTSTVGPPLPKRRGQLTSE